MKRSQEPEIMDRGDLSKDQWQKVFSGLLFTHRLLGTPRILAKMLRQEGPVLRVLDIGCGDGALLAEVGRRVVIYPLGVDLNPAEEVGAPFKIFKADAIKDELPQSDVAIAVLMLHHLSETEVNKFIQNVSRSSKRLIIIDLVRHPLPLFLFNIFIAPMLGKINRKDGRQSVRRAYTPLEFNRIIRSALKPRQTFTHTVKPFYILQIADIIF